MRYALYLVLGVIVPGMLVHRALRGQPDDVVADVSIGAATGVFLALVGWAGWLLAAPLARSHLSSSDSRPCATPTTMPGSTN